MMGFLEGLSHLAGGLLDSAIDHASANSRSILKQYDEHAGDIEAQKRKIEELKKKVRPDSPSAQKLKSQEGKIAAMEKKVDMATQFQEKQGQLRDISSALSNYKKGSQS